MSTRLSKPLPQLTSALSALAAECTRTAPPDVHREFPDFGSELQDMLVSKTAEQLQAVMASLECEAPSNATAFALRAFQSALDIHSTWSRVAVAGADAAAFVADFGTFAPAPQTQLEELLSDPPPAVRAAFPDFERELRAMVERPVDELRTTVSQLEMALANLLEGRLFSEVAGEEPSSAALEAQAMYFSLSALTAAIHEAEALSDVAGLHRVMCSKARRSPTPQDGAIEGGQPAAAVRTMLPHELSELQALLPGALDTLTLEGMDVDVDCSDCPSGTTARDRYGSCTAGTGDAADDATADCFATAPSYCFVRESSAESIDSPAGAKKHFFQLPGSPCDAGGALKQHLGQHCAHGGATPALAHMGAAW